MYTEQVVISNFTPAHSCGILQTQGSPTHHHKLSDHCQVITSLLIVLEPSKRLALKQILQILSHDCTALQSFVQLASMPAKTCTPAKDKSSNNPTTVSGTPGPRAAALLLKAALLYKDLKPTVPSQLPPLEVSANITDSIWDYLQAQP